MARCGTLSLLFDQVSRKIYGIKQNKVFCKVQYLLLLSFIIFLQSEKELETSENVCVIESPKRKSFSEEEIQRIHEVFSTEINENKVDFRTVRMKVKDDEVLGTMTPRRVYDEVRRMLPSNEPRQAELLMASETIDDKMNRLQEISDTSDASDVNNKCSTSNTESRLAQQLQEDDDFVPRSITSSQKFKDLFGPAEIKLLNDGFRDVISGISVRENLIEKAIKVIHQRRNCLKYLVWRQ